MNIFIHKESKLETGEAIYSKEIASGDGWLYPIMKDQTLRIVDLYGNQAVDTLFYGTEDENERYSATETIKSGGLYLTCGSKLMSNIGREMMTITADTCGRHDTIGGACSAESNAVRYGLDKQPMHSCRDTFLKCLWQFDGHLTKRDLTANINFFMNVPVTEDGSLEFVDGVSAPGKYVEMKATMDILCLISNCPQLNNPCNDYNPTPIQVLIWN